MLAQIRPISSQSNYTGNHHHMLLDANTLWFPAKFYNITTNASTIAVTICSDVDSALNGVIIKQSPTITGNLVKIDRFTYISNDKETRTFYVPVLYEYFKIEYMNGKKMQSMMELTTSLFTYPQAVKGL